MPMLYARGMRVWANSAIDAVGDGEIEVLTGDGVRVTIPCDAILDASDLVSNAGLLDEVSVAETYAVGDCAEPFNIALAIRAGNDAGRAL